MAKVLVVDDEKMIVKGIRFSLMQEQMEVDCAYDGEEAVEKARNTEYDIVLLDVMLPKLDGFQVCQQIREFSNMPIIMLTAKGDDMDKILGLDYGADDYITKPFNIKVVMQRIQAVLRRVEGTSHDTAFTCGNLTIDFETHTVKKSGENLSLTPTEFKLLYVFVKNSGMALTRSLLLEKLWDNEGNFVDEHTLTINISRLRSKISDETYHYIKTIYGMGYQWIGDAHE